MGICGSKHAKHVPTEDTIDSLAAMNKDRRRSVLEDHQVKVLLNHLKPLPEYLAHCQLRGQSSAFRFTARLNKTVAKHLVDTHAELKGYVLCGCGSAHANSNVEVLYFVSAYPQHVSDKADRLAQKMRVKRTATLKRLHKLLDKQYNDAMLQFKKLVKRGVYEYTQTWPHGDVSPYDAMVYYKKKYDLKKFQITHGDYRHAQWTYQG
jgi:hypothetical protein